MWCFFQIHRTDDSCSKEMRKNKMLAMAAAFVALSFNLNFSQSVGADSFRSLPGFIVVTRLHF